MSELSKKKTTLFFLKSEKKKNTKKPSQLFYMHTLLAKNHSQYSSWTATSYNASVLIINPRRRGSYNLLCLLGMMSKNYKTVSHFVNGLLMTPVSTLHFECYTPKCHSSTSLTYRSPCVSKGLQIQMKV